MTLYRWAFLLGVFALTACGQVQKPHTQDELVAPFQDYGAAPIIRVMLTAPTEKGSAIVDAGKSILTLDGNTVQHEGSVTITSNDLGLQVGDYGSAKSVEIAPEEQSRHFTVNGRIYRGKARFFHTANGFECVNVVDLEQYVAGVIGWEMIAGWPLEALKAQAVASRTYALFEMQLARSSSRQWDVDDSTRYQVYGGVGPANKPKLWRETAKVLQARKETNGEVLTYNGKGFRAFFHSTSGGYSTDVRTGLGFDLDVTPLRGADLGTYCKDAPKYLWTINLKDSEVGARLIENGMGNQDIMKMEKDESSVSGHAVTIKMYNTRGRAVTVDARELRRVLGLYSTNFEAHRDGSIWSFTGKGYGHGCGMCQWSARGMAKDGWAASRILEAMYPGAKLETIY
ncbi:SpoIID/LytB domain-containing protein [Planctomycetota bacterium]|nr:SpoIID/LytB domain-containing protein [Planctomycetota bacterium]